MRTMLHQPTNKKYNIDKKTTNPIGETIKMKRGIDFDPALGMGLLMTIEDMLFGNGTVLDEPHQPGYITTTGTVYDTNKTTGMYPSTSDRTCSCGCETKPDMKFKDILNDVKSVIFNDPATIVTFSDGSKVCVKACSKDTFNKETGLIYAIIKRLYANEIEKGTGYLRSSGLGEKITKIVNNAVDQKERERERRRKQKEKQAKKEKAKAENKTPSNADQIQSPEEAKEATDTKS